MDNLAIAAPVEREDRTGSNALSVHEIVNLGDRELEDVIFSWRRVSDPKLRKIALELLRSMAS